MYQSPELNAALSSGGNPFDERRVGTFTSVGRRETDTAKMNKDRGIVIHPFNGDASQSLFCIFDGHGDAGHNVAEFMMLRLPELLERDGTRLATDELTEKSLSRARAAR